MYDDYPRRQYGRGDYGRYPEQPRYTERARTEVYAGKLWAGGAATALVAALVAFIGLLIARGIFGLDVLAPSDEGLVGDGDTAWLVLLAALAAFAATGLMHLLLLSTPRPDSFFAAIVGLLTVLVALQPFLTDADLSAKIASMLIYAATGAAIGVLISNVASYAQRTVVTSARPPGYYPEPPRSYPDDTRGHGGYPNQRGYPPYR